MVYVHPIRIENIRKEASGYDITAKKTLDMLHGSIWNKIPQFALPVAATAILEQLFNASDIAVVGNFTGAMRTVAVAAVGANSPVIGLIVNLFIGIALGTNVVIAHAIGQGKKEDVQRAVHTTIVIALIGGVLVAILGELIAHPLLGMLHVPEDVFPSALLYLRVFGISLMPAVLTTLGVCGTRIAWIRFLFPHSRTFRTIMTAYPVSLSITAFLIFVALLCYHPSRS